ncbi:MAG TPA: CoA transferase [Pseudomonadales bacterium]|nr:CoA transferase [Pseudomonadales bacterium]
MVAPLDDITVIEIDSWMAGPSAAAILADLGATVIKIEPLAGDPMRGNGRPPKLEGEIRDYDFQFDVDNRGKQSILIDLANPAGADIVHKLCEGAQVFMCNLLPRRQKKFGLDPASLQKSNPGIVHATLTGYGTTGPDAWRPGYDVTAFFGRSGLYDAMREGEHGIVPMARPAQGDHSTGLAFAGAIMAALRLAERTGEAQVVETSLYETAVWTQASDYCTTVVDKAPVRQRAREEMLLPTANRYPCGDGKWIVLNMPEPAWWPRFCRALGREDWIEDERFETPRQRYRLMHELVPAIDDILSKKSRDEWGKIFDAEGLIWGPVLALHEVASDHQAEAIGLFPTLEDEQIGTYRTVNIPMRFETADVGPRHRSPRPGEQTAAILERAGYDGDAIKAMFSKNIVA